MGLQRVSVTDELLDAYVNRPLAKYVVRAVERTGVTPNHLTLVSALWGTAAGVCFAMPHPLAVVAGAAALLVSMVFDCSDGQLARVRGGGSPLGRILDGYADYWVGLSVHVGMLVSLLRANVEIGGRVLGGFEVFLLVLAAGVSMAVNSGRFDFYKQRFLAHTGMASQPETPETYRAEAARTTSRIARRMLRAFAVYVATIQKGDGYRQGVEAARRTASDPALVAEYRRENGALVRLWSFSGPTMHNAAMCAAACLVPFERGAFAGYCLFALLFVNAYSCVLWVMQRRVLRREVQVTA